MTTEHNNLPSSFAGTVSHGTMRNEDLAPRFLDILDEAADLGVIREGEAEDRRAEWEDMGEDAHETATEFVVSLFDRLNEIAPEGTYFGAHEGDGADYGFWYSLDEWEDEDDHEENPYAGPGGLLDEFRQAERLIGTE